MPNSRQQDPFSGVKERKYTCEGGHTQDLVFLELDMLEGPGLLLTYQWQQGLTVLNPCQRDPFSGVEERKLYMGWLTHAGFSFSGS